MDLSKLRLEACHPDSPQCLSSLLDAHPDASWPIRDLLLIFQDIWKVLPEQLKINNDTVVQNLRSQVKSITPSIPHLIETDSRPALIDIQSGRNLSHAAIRNFVQSFRIPNLTSKHLDRKPRVAVILPNGPLLALAVLAVANAYTIVPMASNAAPEQLHMDMDQVRADAVLALEGDIPKLQLETGQRPVYAVQPKDDLTFSLVSSHHHSSEAQTTLAPNTGDDIAVILFTSGTSGTKKLVPITTYNLIAGTVFTMESVELSSSDCCLNMMPLNHV